MNTKFCFLVSLALVGSVSITVLSPKQADASRARTAKQGVEFLVKYGRLASALGFLQQNWPWLAGGTAALTIGGIGMSVIENNKN